MSLNKYKKEQVNINYGRGSGLKPFSKNNGITLIALVITIVVMLLLVSIGLSLALSKGGLVEKAVTGKQETLKAQSYFEARHKVADIVTKGESEGLSKEQINGKIDEFFGSSEGKELLEKIKMDFDLENLDQAKQKVVDAVWHDKENTNASTLPPIEDKDRAPMILSMDLDLDTAISLSDLPEGCYIDWGDGVKSRSISSTQTGIKDVKLYGNFNKAYLGPWAPTSSFSEQGINYIEYLNPNIQNLKYNNSTIFNSCILEVKDWGENNFGEISFAEATRLTSYAQPRVRSFENLEYASTLFYGTGITKIDSNFFANAPNLKSVFNIDERLHLPIDIFKNNSKLEFVALNSLKFFDQGKYFYQYDQIFSNNKNLKVVLGDVIVNDNIVKYTPNLEGFEGYMKGNFGPDVFHNLNNLKKINLQYSGLLHSGLLANMPKLEHVELKYWVEGSLSEDLFKNSPNLKEISFWSCGNLVGPIPEKIFETNTNLEKVSFGDCYKLTGTLSEKLFANNLKLKDLSHCFSGCTPLTGKAPKYWESLPLVNADKQNWASIYNGCLNLDLSGIDENAIYG